MGYQKIVINGGIHDWCILLISLILLLVTSSSATFNQISDISLNDVPGVWRGIPEVTIETVGSIVSRDCQICVDDTYWNTDIADIVCQYNGFEGSMIVKRDTTPAETGPFLDLDGYAVCKKFENSDLPLECEFRETCERVPTISCLADVTGECGTSEPVELIPNQPYYVTSPGYPGRHMYTSAGSYTWTLGINVNAFHNLEVMATYNSDPDNLLSINSKSINATYSGDGTSTAVKTPYVHLQDTITVTFTVSSPSTLNDFSIKFSLTPNSMYTTAPDMPTISNVERTSQPDEPTLTNVERTGPTNAPVIESTTSKAMQAVSTSADTMYTSDADVPTNLTVEQTSEPDEPTQRNVERTGPTNAPVIESTTSKAMRAVSTSGFLAAVGVVVAFALLV